VSGLNADGKSMIESDGNTGTRVATEAFTVCQIWQVDSLPPDVLTKNALGDGASISPPLGGFAYMVTTMPPDSEWDLASGYKEALAASSEASAYIEDESGIPGMHETDTVDIVTVISGELYAVLEADETLLRAGDSFVQRGTKHAWSNRSDGPCTIVAVMMAATR
jgi:mannose-6-phosphate isomerase-like protein (cupin superfamily)